MEPDQCAIKNRSRADLADDEQSATMNPFTPAWKGSKSTYTESIALSFDPSIDNWGLKANANPSATNKICEWLSSNGQDQMHISGCEHFKLQRVLATSTLGLPATNAIKSIDILESRWV